MESVREVVRTGTAPPLRALWDARDFRLLFLAGLLSELGTFVSEVAILMRIFELAGGHKAWLGITQGLFLLMLIAGTVLGGVVGERAPKRLVLIACEVARVPVLLAMLLGTHSLWTLVCGNALVALFSGAFNPTRQAWTNQLLPPALLPRANSLFAVTFALLHAIGPLAGGTLYGFTGVLWPILAFDLATYFVGIALLLAIADAGGARTAAGKADAAGILDDAVAGLALVRTCPGFGALLLRCFLASFVLGIAIPLLLPFSIEVLGQPEWFYGLLLGVFGLGGVGGGLLAARAARHLPIPRLLQLLFAGECVVFFAWTFARLPLLSLALAFVYGALLLARIASQLSFVSFHVPHDYNARANALVDLAMVIPNVIGAGCIALLGAVDTQALFTVTGAALAAVAVTVMVAERRLRR
jgi:MFS family permease